MRHSAVKCQSYVWVHFAFRKAAHELQNAKHHTNLFSTSVGRRTVRHTKGGAAMLAPHVLPYLPRLLDVLREVQ